MPTSTKAVGATKGTILVVEDAPPVRDLLRLHLENADYAVVTAPDAVVAGKLLLRESAAIDLLVVDAHMPYMTGIEFAAAIIADSTLPPLPIVLITGHDDLAARAEVLDVPCLLKPFTADDLVRVVERSLSRKPLLASAGLKEKGMSKLMRHADGQARG